MLTLTIYKWPEVELEIGLEHVSTDWEVASDVGFTDIIDSIYESTDFITLYTSNVVVPEGITFYARARRVFNDGSKSNWIESSVQATTEFAYTPLGKDYIAYPSIVVDDSSDPSNIIITTSAFYSGIDSHAFTNWCIKNKNGDTIYHSLKDATNLTSITVAKTLIGYDNLNSIDIFVSYGGISGRHSKVGYKHHVITDFKFVVTSNLVSVSPFKSYLLTWDLLTEVGDPYPLSSVTVKDSDGTVLVASALTNETAILVPKELIEENQTYYFDFKAAGNDDDVKRITMVTHKDIVAFSVDHEFVYSGEYAATGITFGDAMAIYGSEQFLDNRIPVAIANDGAVQQVLLYNFNEETNIFAQSIMQTLNVGSNFSCANFMVGKRFEVITDTTDLTSGDRTFKRWFYREQTVANSFTFQAGINTSGKPHAVTLDLGNELIYFFTENAGEHILKSWNMTTSEVKTYDARPDSSSDAITLDYLLDGNLLSIGGSDKAYIFDTKFEKWTPIGMVPTSMAGRAFTSFADKAGNITIFPINTDLLGNGVIVFKVSDYTFEEVATGLDQNVKLDTTTRLRNGEFLRYDSSAATKELYIYR